MMQYSTCVSYDTIANYVLDQGAVPALNPPQQQQQDQHDDDIKSFMTMATIDNTFACETQVNELFKTWERLFRV